MEKLDSIKIRKFLGSLNSVEFRYLELAVQMVGSLQTTIKRFNLNKERFCELFDINIKVFDRYTKGDFDYSIEDLAKVNYVYQKLEKEQIEKEELIRIKTDND